MHATSSSCTSYAHDVDFTRSLSHHFNLLQQKKTLYDRNRLHARE